MIPMTYIDQLRVYNDTEKLKKIFKSIYFVAILMNKKFELNPAYLKLVKQISEDSKTQQKQRHKRMISSINRLH